MDKWNYKIGEVVKSGRQPQLRSAAVCAVYRDAGREKEVWRMSCLIQHFDPYFRESLTDLQYKSLMVQWSSGRLDPRLTPEVLAMRPDFKPQDLAFLFTDVATELVPNYFEDQNHKEQSSSLEKLLKKLRGEQANFRREVALRKAADGNFLGLHATWSQKVEEAVDELWEGHLPNYQVFSSPDLPSGHRSLVGARADLIGLDMPGAVKAEQLPSICVWNLPMLGSSASTVVQAVCNTIADDCANNPQLTLHLVCPPNQASYGKTSDPDTDARQAEVLEHQGHWLMALQDPARELAVIKVLLDSAHCEMFRCVPVVVPIVLLTFVYC
jgi:hypothetical protein